MNTTPLPGARRPVFAPQGRAVPTAATAASAASAVSAVSAARRTDLPAWFATLRQWRPACSTERLILLTSLFFALCCNGLFWRAAMEAQPGDLRLGVSILLALTGIHALLMGLIVWRWNAKVLLGLLLVVTALAAHYMRSFHVYLDVSMLRNVLATDLKETRELLTPALVPPLLALAGLPMLALWRVRVIRRSWPRALAWRAGFLLAAAGVAAAGALLSFQDLSALMRNQREARYLVTPGNYLVGLPRTLGSASLIPPKARIPVGLDARLADGAAKRPPRLLVLVVGETARAGNWGLNGYARQTTPQLAREDVVNFTDVHACGTNTEVSVPCMFSPFGRRHYDEDKIRSHESLLHVLERAGVGTLWRDNQSGCKGVCQDLDAQRLDNADNPALCAGGRCLDEILLDGLEAQARARPGDRLIVLHQLGSHGPSYFQRHPPRFRQFTPTCDTADLGKCSRDEIVNSYDNTLLYTDHFLARAIERLRDMKDYDTAMIYLSDHGESLGEKGLYLHGMPYAIAPREQTRVPMTMWFSPRFADRRGLDLGCLRERARGQASHDNLFASVLGLMQVQTSAYDSGQDLFSGCARRAAAP